jgi:hypothetical protein
VAAIQQFFVDLVLVGTVVLVADKEWVGIKVVTVAVKGT